MTSSSNAAGVDEETHVPSRPPHQRDSVPEPLPNDDGDEQRDIWDERVAGALAFLRRRLTGDYDVDEFGFDKELTDGLIQPLLRPLYRDWFRVEVSGAKHVPVEGSGLVVANHSGTVALDALMLSVAIREERRYLRLLGADLVFRLPILSELARKSGATLACQPDAERLLGTGELVGVFPEGFKGVGKLYRDRYKLQRFGRGGFVAAALRTGTPDRPGRDRRRRGDLSADRQHQAAGPAARHAVLSGDADVPVARPAWPDPVAVEVADRVLRADRDRRICGDQADDPMVVFNLADQVRETIQQTIHELLARRPEAF